MDFWKISGWYIENWLGETRVEAENEWGNCYRGPGKRKIMFS